MTPLEKTILATVSYYDIFDYPLTGFEIWRYLICAKDFKGSDFKAGLPRHSFESAGSPRYSVIATAGDVFSALHESELLKTHIGHNFGFYYLLGRERIVEKRLWRKKLADQKWKKLKRVFKILALVPYVRGIFVSGSLAMENSKDDSDVDIIVVAKSGRIWTVRTLMTLLTFMLGVRRHGEKTKDRICLNHYIIDESLRIPFESLYNAESYVHLLNVYVEDAEIFRRFQEENIWLRKYIINYQSTELHSARAVRKNKFFLVLVRISEAVLGSVAGDRLEKIFSAVESKRIQRDPLYLKAGGRITIDNTQLEFHPDSHEHFIMPEFNRRMRDLGLTEFAEQKDSGLNK